MRERVFTTLKDSSEVVVVVDDDDGLAVDSAASTTAGVAAEAEAEVDANSTPDISTFDDCAVW